MTEEQAVAVVGDLERLLGVYCTCPEAARYCPLHNSVLLLDSIRKRLQSRGSEDEELLAEVRRRGLDEDIIAWAGPKKVLAAVDEYELLHTIGEQTVRNWLYDLG